MRVALYPGSFDPVTYGHLDIIARASKIFDKVLVAALINPAKHTLFTVEERIELLKTATDSFENVEVLGFDGLLADYARDNDIHVIVKGLRAVSDFDYEFQMALTNKSLNPDMETIFFTTSAENMFLSSSVVKQIASFGGDVSKFVPPCVNDVLRKRLREDGAI